ncbi:MAG: NAD-dependent epimerase/dehydratase [Microgenomates group bacterium GW2011_GWC1_43_13]|nr:MAG: NAD-dependent epimerase/dehydratase [Microgenomates group bacterium GW2011_GWC1_43_13]
MKILITGSSGFVGTHLVKKLSKKYEIVSYDLMHGQDVLNGKLLTQKLKGVDLVIHLAAFISATESWEKPMDYMRNNALGTLSVINCAIKTGVKKIIFFSSAAVKAKPLTPYAVSKINAEEIINLYYDKINTVIVRPENIYGLGQKANYGYVIHNFIKAVKTGKPLNIYGDGKQTRDFIYIDDVTGVVERLINLDIKSGSIVSLGTGKEIRIVDLAKLVMKVMNRETIIKHMPKRSEPLKSMADVRMLSKLKIDAGKFTDLEKGIRGLL